MIKRIEKYGATWCGPCKVLAKTLDNIKKNYPDIEFLAFDADEDEGKFEEMKITNVPQLFFFDENGKEVEHLVGANPANKIIEIITANS